MTLLSVRYGVPALLILVGIVCLFAAPDGTEPEAFALFAGAGFAVLLLNVLFRIGVQGDRERDREDEARAYFAKHGRWPDEQENRARDWRLPENVTTPEDEERRQPRRS